MTTRVKAWTVVSMLLAFSTKFFGCAAAYNAHNESTTDYRHSVVCNVRGAFGRKYYSDTAKRVIISIYSHGPNDRALLQEDLRKELESGGGDSHPIPGLETKMIFEKICWIKGSDLEWHAVWGPDNSLSVTFYDYGAGKEGPPSPAPMAEKRTLRTINFSFDPSTGIYTEAAQGANRSDR